MKAMTIRPPYADMVAAGIKPIETRNWKTKYRGPVAIHVGKTIDWDSWILLRDSHIHDFLKERHDYTMNSDNRGEIIAIADLVCIKQYSSFDSFTIDFLSHFFCPDCASTELWAKYGWIFQRSSIHRLKKPIPWSGRQGLFEVPDNVFNI